MKKLQFFLLALLVSVGASAQTIIPKVGGTFSNFAFSDDIKDGLFGLDPKFKLGFQLGVGYEIAVAESFAIQPELLFTQKGAMIEESGDKVTFTLNYLELPIMFKYKFSNFYVNAGPYFAYGLGGKVKVKPDGGSDESYKIKFGDEPSNGSDDFYLDNALDFGFQIGGGVLVMEKIIIDLRYGYGFGNLIDEVDGIDNKWQNRSIQLTVGYPISFN